MNKNLKVMAALAILSISLIKVSAAADKAEPKYKGNKICIACHKKRDNSTTVWEKMKHAQAFASLATPAAKKSSKDPQNDAKCLACHTTGFGKTGGYSLTDKNAALQNVQCEACHGAGGNYISVMTKAMKPGSKFDAAAAAAAGMVKPTKEVCVKCHNKQSPNYKEFKFDEFAKKIKHGEKIKK